MQVSSRVTVLGGGISGLSAAYFLAKKHSDPSKITLVEGSSRLGGWVHSVQAENGAIFEQGPRSLRPVGIAGWSTLKLASELGLEDQIIPISTSHVGAQNRFIYSKGEIHKLPNSILSIIQKQSLYSKSLLTTILKEPFVKKRTDDSDESVYEFFCRRLNKDVAEYIADPLCRGIFAGDARLLSVKSALFPAYEMERKHGSIVKAVIRSEKPAPDPHPLVQRVIKEKWSIWSLQGGLQTLTNKLHKSLVNMGVQIKHETPCNAVDFNPNGTVVVHSGDQKLTCDHLICSLSSNSAAGLLEKSHPMLKEYLNSIDMVSVGLVNLEYKGNIIKNGGFGVLVPSSEPVNVLGIIYDSCVFPQLDSPQGDSTRLTIMMGGHWFKEHLGNQDTITPETLTSIAVEGVGKILGITQEPRQTMASVKHNCIAQYNTGHSNRVDKIFRYIQKNKLPLTLIGSSYNGVSVQDCVLNALKGVERIGV